MAYNRHTWTDRINEFANRFRLTATAESDVYDLERVTGEVTEAGTPITAAWLNEMEAGIEGAAPEDHTHGMPDLNGILPIIKGGTGAGTRTGALDALGALGFRGALYGNDLDALYEPGMYYVTGSGAADIVNSPFPGYAFALIVSSETDSAGIRRVQQFAARTTANIFKIRSFVIGSDGSVTHRDFDEISFKDGNVATATALQTARTIRTNLGSTTAASFDGSANVTPGVTGTLPIANGGTGAATKAAARTNLGAAAETHTHTASDFSGKLPITKGGTNATTAAAALTNLGAAAASHTHTAGDVSFSVTTISYSSVFTTESGITVAGSGFRSIGGKWIWGWMDISSFTTNSYGEITVATVKLDYRGSYNDEIITALPYLSGEGRIPSVGHINANKLVICTGRKNTSFSEMRIYFRWLL